MKVMNLADGGLTGMYINNANAQMKKYSGKSIQETK